MDTRTRQSYYTEAVKKDSSITENTKVSDAFGVSNTAKIIEKGLFAFNVNFNTISNSVDQVVVNCLLRFPPEDEVYFSIFVKSDIDIFLARLEEMKASGSSNPRRSSNSSGDTEGEADGGDDAGDEEGVPSPDGLVYTNNSKNIKGYIALDGKLYLRNKGYWDCLPSDLSSISKPSVIDKVLFGIYPPSASTRRSLLARQFIGYLGSLLGHEKIHEVQAWPNESNVHEDMRRLPSSIPLKDIEGAIENLGGYYPGGEVRRYHAGLSYLDHKHFVILSGLSGTGKTQLALKYARAVHGLKDMVAPDPFLIVCPVRPEWTDPSGLTGYYDVLSNRYMVPPFLEAVLLATAHRDSPVFVVLDEMNLARVEYYFSDVLSCIETGQPLPLHSSGIPLEGSTGISIPAELHLPNNLFITSTINIDESTNPISDKVLDRAVLIDMSAVQISGFLDNLVKRDTSIQSAREACQNQIIGSHTLMSEHGLGFGYRVTEEVIRYYAYSYKLFGSESKDIIDELMVQKILVKLRGTEKQRRLLLGLMTVLDGLPFSIKFLQRLINDLDEFGSFQAGR
ncbi:MAG: hypothetical protein HQK82_08240 [Desulfovibrionaceae bacterium]|nr:hypothetical protein [Desulfovibrionaceae bacterium]